MRNPWGKGEWKGAWSDNSHEWNQVDSHTKQQMDFKKADDGVFFIPFEDFERYYSDFQICYYHDNYQLSSFPVRTQVNETLEFEFQIKHAGQYYFSLNQENRRFWKKTDGYKYSQCALIIVRKGSTGVHMVGSCSKKDKEYWFKAECVPGHYYGQIYTPWESHSRKICFTSYGPEKVQIRKLNPGTINSEWIGQAIAEDACNDKEGWKPYKQQGYGDIAYKFEHGGTGIGYFAFYNDNKSTTLTCTINLVKHQGVHLQGKYKGQTKPSISVGPGKREAIWYRMGAGASIAFSMMAQFKGGGGGGHGHRGYY